MKRPKRTLIAPIVAAGATAFAARHLRALSLSGVLASTAVGGVIASGPGTVGAAALLAFFASSTLLGRLPQSHGRQQRRGNERDAVQVLANGGVAAALALAITVRPGDECRFLLSGFGGALAAATADTWATEIGSRASTRPRSILTGRFVPVGSSGGVSAAGLLASAAGAASIAAIVGVGAPRRSAREPSLIPAVTLGGVCGALADSVLGAAIQEVRFCEACGEETELLRHGCGRPTAVVRGFSGFDNDVVNFAATCVGAATAAVIARSSSTRTTAAQR